MQELNRIASWDVVQELNMGARYGSRTWKATTVGKEWTTGSDGLGWRPIMGAHNRDRGDKASAGRENGNKTGTAARNIVMRREK